MAARTPPARTYSEKCTRLFGTEDDTNDAASLYRPSTGARRMSSLSTPVSLWDADTDLDRESDRRYSSSLASSPSTSPTSCLRWPLRIAGLVLVAYFAGSHGMTRDLQLELQRQVEAKDALEAAQGELLQETQQLQELKHQQERLESKLKNLTNELLHKQESLHQESQKAAQREYEVEQLKSSMSTGEFLRSGSLGLGNQATAANDDLVSKMVQNMGYEHYGLRPRRIEIHLAYLNKDKREENHYLIGELSMLYSPVSAFTFLSQVEHGLYHHVDLQVETGTEDEFESDGPSDPPSFLVTSLSDLQWRERDILGLARVPVRVEGSEISESNANEVHPHRYQIGFSDEGTLFLTLSSTFRKYPQASWFASIIVGDSVLDEIFHGATASIEIVSIHLLSEAEHEHVDAPIDESIADSGSDHEHRGDRLPAEVHQHPQIQHDSDP